MFAGCHFAEGVEIQGENNRQTSSSTRVWKLYVEPAQMWELQLKQAGLSGGELIPGRNHPAPAVMVIHESEEPLRKNKLTPGASKSCTMR